MCLRGETSVEHVGCDVAGSAFVRVVLFHPDLGLKPQLVHELVDQLMVDHPALVTKVEQYPPVAVAVFVALETVPDRLLEPGMFIRCGESFLVVEKR